MLDQLKKNPGKIPQQSRDEMMDMFNNTWQEEYDRIDNVDTYKKNMITVALDGSEDHLAGKKLMDLVGEELLAFREELLKSEPVSSLKTPKKQITPPEGMRRSTKPSNTDDPLPDEGYELYDGDGEDLEEESDEVLEEEQEDIVEDDSVEEPTEDHENPLDHSTPQVADVSNVPDHPDVKLVRKILEKVNDVRGRCTKALLPCLIQIDGKPRNEERRLRKEARKTDGILKEALTTEHNEQGEDEKDEADHVSNDNEETNNEHYMSDDDRNAFDILA